MDIADILASPAFWAAVVVGVFGLWLTIRRSGTVAKGIVQQLEDDGEEHEQSRKRGKRAANDAERTFLDAEAQLRQAAERKYTEEEP